jgi:predicted Zn-dependent protease
LFLTDDLPGSLDVYKGILDRIEDDDNALYNAAVLSLKLEQKEDALSYFTRLYSLKPDPLLLFRIGSLSLELNKITDAISYLEAYREKNSAHFETLLALGRAYAVDELYFESLSAYDEALAVQEGNRNALFEKAAILLKYVEDEENGLESFNSAIENGYDNKERLQNLIDYPDLIALDEIMKTIESKGLLDEEEGDTESTPFDETPGEPLAPLDPQ